MGILFATGWLNRSQKERLYRSFKVSYQIWGHFFFPSTFVIYVSWHNPVWCCLLHIKLVYFWRTTYVSLQWCMCAYVDYSRYKVYNIMYFPSCIEQSWTSYKWQVIIIYFENHSRTLRLKTTLWDIDVYIFFYFF